MFGEKPPKGAGFTAAAAMWRGLPSEDHDPYTVLAKEATRGSRTVKTYGKKKKVAPKAVMQNETPAPELQPASTSLAAGTTSSHREIARISPSPALPTQGPSNPDNDLVNSFSSTMHELEE